MEFMYSIDGGNKGLTESFNIDKAAVIQKGQAVKFIGGKVALTGTGAYLGVAAEDHSGQQDAFNPRQNGENINVIISPGAVFAGEAPVFDFVSSTDNTSAIFAVANSIEDGEINGGWIVCVKKAANSDNTDAPGTARKITNYVKSTKKLTVSEGGKIVMGDTYALIPPVGFTKLKISADGKNLDLNTAGGDFLAVGKDLSKKKIYVIIKNHLLKA